MLSFVFMPSKKGYRWKSCWAELHQQIKQVNQIDLSGWRGRAVRDGKNWPIWGKRDRDPLSFKTQLMAPCFFKRDFLLPPTWRKFSSTGSEKWAFVKKTELYWGVCVSYWCFICVNLLALIMALWNWKIFILWKTQQILCGSPLLFFFWSIFISLSIFQSHSSILHTEGWSRPKGLRAKPVKKLLPISLLDYPVMWFISKLSSHPNPTVKAAHSQVKSGHPSTPTLNPALAPFSSQGGHLSNCLGFLESSVMLVEL